MNYWLLKSEPGTFSIDDLAVSPEQTTGWEGVRNYQARNFLRDKIQVGDQAFFAHSSCKIPGIAGIVEVVRAGYPDETAFDKNSPYYEPKSSPSKPRWFKIDVKLIKRFPEIISLQTLRANPLLQDMILLKAGNRLSVMPVSRDEWRCILKMVST